MGFCENWECNEYAEGYCKKSLVPVISEKSFYRCLVVKDLKEPLTIKEVDAVCCEEKLKFKRSERGLSYHPEDAICLKCGKEYERNPNSQLIYTEIKVDNKSVWFCCQCGSVIMAERVAHPIWDGPFPMSGSGECYYEPVPYCPNCETKPSFHGTPVRPNAEGFLKPTSK